MVVLALDLRVYGAEVEVQLADMLRFEGGAFEFRIVCLAGLGSLALALGGGPWLLATVGLSLAIGTA